MALGGVGVAVLLTALAAADIEVPSGRPSLTRAPEQTIAGAACSSDADEIVDVLQGTTLRDFQLLERLGGTSLGAAGGGFVGANAAVYRAVCIAPSCRKTWTASTSAQFAIKVMFRPEVQEESGLDSRTRGLACAIAPGSHAGASDFASPAERMELALQGLASKPARVARHKALLPIYHCFVDNVDPAQLPDWETDSDGATAHTGGGNVGQVPRGAKSTLFFVMPLTGPNLHHYAAHIIHSRLAAAARRKQLGGSPDKVLTAHETQNVQALPVFSTVAWVGIAAQLAAGLAHLAEAGLAHRDVKLDNILLTAASFEESAVMNDDVPTVTLADFGAALDAQAVLKSTNAPPPPSGGRHSAPLRVPAQSSLVCVAGGAKRRGGNPYNLPPEVLLAPIESADGNETPHIDYTGADSWGLGTVMHELVAPTIEPWPGLRAATSPFDYSYVGENYQFLRASFRPTLPDLLTGAEPPETGFALGVAVVAAGLVDKCLLLPISQPNRGDKSPIRLPITEAREGFAALLLLLWWEKHHNGFENLKGGSKKQTKQAKESSAEGWRAPQVGPPLEVVQTIVATAQAELSGHADAAQSKIKGKYSGGPWWVLQEYLTREPAVIVHQRLSWLYEVYGAGLSAEWPHVAEGTVWPPRDGPWKLAHEKRRSEPETTLDGALGGAIDAQL